MSKNLDKIENLLNQNLSISPSGFELKHKLEEFEEGIEDDEELDSELHKDTEPKHDPNLPSEMW